MCETFLAKSCRQKSYRAVRLLLPPDSGEVLAAFQKDLHQTPRELFSNFAKQQAEHKYRRRHNFVLARFLQNI